MVAGLAIAYLFGSMPTGYLAGKLLRGIDIRQHGSKSTGATNVLRTLGTWPALVVLLIDVRERRGGNRLCPPVLSLALDIAVRRAADSA